MILPPWLVWVPALALINLFIFIAIRGRWGRSTFVLAVASAIGVVVGDQIAAGVGVELVRIGDMNVLGASLAAQAFMLAVHLLSALGPVEIGDDA